MFGYRKITLTTIHNWMHRLGYKLCRVQKHYYNDKHEADENVIYRNKYNPREPYKLSGPTQLAKMRARSR
jgi:hypothetical protein